LKQMPLLLILVFVLAGCGSSSASGAVQRGEELYNQVLIEGVAPGCYTCHSTEAGVVRVGPSHAHIADRAEQIVQSPDYTGQATSAAEFLRESILAPNVYVEQGFQPGVMYQEYGEVLSDQQVDDLVAYLMTLR
jgi:cytochrome c553